MQFVWGRATRPSCGAKLRSLAETKKPRLEAEAHSAAPKGRLISDNYGIAKAMP
jgi:hypothetical protein